MTPKEKAKELVDRFYNEVKYMERAKVCALIAVDEIINSNPHIYIEIGGSDCRGDWSYKEAQSNQLYWKEVKHEIKKL